MAKRIRTITDAQCANLLADLEDLKLRFRQVLSRHQPLVRDEWLGGNKDEDNHEEGPPALWHAFNMLEQGEKCLIDADHRIAMFRAKNGSPSA